MHIYIFIFICVFINIYECCAYLYIRKSQHGYNAFVDIIWSYIGALNFAAKNTGTKQGFNIKNVQK